jgi:hypothetical protein
MPNVLPEIYDFLVCGKAGRDPYGRINFEGVFQAGVILVPANVQTATIGLVAVWMFTDGHGTFKAVAGLSGPPGFGSSQQRLPDVPKDASFGVTIPVNFKGAPPMPIGKYEVTLTLDSRTYKRWFEIRRDPSITGAGSGQSLPYLLDQKTVN